MEQKWLTTRWIGNALRRLGFREKRRVGTGYQYKICKGEVEDLANRLNIKEAPHETEEETELQKLEEIKQWILNHRKDGTVSSIELTAYIKTLNLEPSEIIKKLTEEEILFELPEVIGKLGVAQPKGGPPK